MKRSKKRKRIIVFSLLLIIIGGLVTLFYILRPWIFPTLDEIKESVVRIENYDYNGNLISTGSGFCIYESNYIVTNYHVINGADSLNITTNDGTVYRIKDVLITDPQNDLAIISGDFSLKKLHFGSNSNLSSGDKVVAIGSPLGELNTVSTGIISNPNNNKGIQITAPISPGSSGGVLLNKHYHVIGITYASRAEIEGNDLNFAISIDRLKEMKEAYDKGYYFTINFENNDSCRTYESDSSINRLINCGTSNKYFSFSQVRFLGVVSER